MQLLDGKTINEIEYYLPDHGTADKLAAFFEVFSDSSRLRILSALSVSEICVSDLAEILGMNQTTLSHQLRMLKDRGFITHKRQGKTVFYCLQSQAFDKLLMCAAEQCLSEV